MQEDIKKKILEIYNIVSNKNIDINKTSKNALLIKDLGMNSISFIYWILKIEEEFNIEIESLAYSELKTLEDLINLIISKLNK